MKVILNWDGNITSIDHQKFKTFSDIIEWKGENLSSSNCCL